MKKKIALISVLSMLMAMFGHVAPAQAFELNEIVTPILTNPLYVNVATGNDSDPAFIPTEAVKTITRAVEIANSSFKDSFQILIAEGDYSAETYPWDLTQKDISIYGGYDTSFSFRDPEAYITQVKGGSNTTIEIIDHSSTISGLTFYDQTAGDSVIYINHNDAQDHNVTINAVEIANATTLLGSIYAVQEDGDTLNINNNYIHNSNSTVAQITTLGNPASSVIRNNILYNNIIQFGGGMSVTNALLYNNIISTTSGGPALELNEGSAAYNNTVANNEKGIEALGTQSNITIKNNLIVDTTNEALDLGTGTIDVDYNAYWNNGTTPTILGNDIACDPGFSNTMSPLASDYMLDPSSDCIDEGTTINEVATDYSGNVRKKDGNADAVYAYDPGAFEADGDPAMAPTLSSVSALPAIFSPDNDGVNDETTISFDLNTTSNVIVTIYDNNSDIVSQLINEVRSSGTHNVVWDGTDDLATKVPEGAYTFRITAENTEGMDEVNGDITVDLGANASLCAGFTDVSVAHPLCPAITYVKDQGIFQGYPDGTFQPNAVINRVETTKVTLEGFNIPLLPDDGTNQGFSDVIINAWYMGYLRTAKAAAIVEGYPDGTFKPDQQVNRVETLKIFLETSGEDLSGIVVGSDPYPDTPTNAWYILYVQFAQDFNLVDADAQGMFNPGVGMKRGDVAELFFRFNQEGFM